MNQRREFLAGNLLNNQSVTIALTSQTRDRHSSHRKCDFHRISKAKWGIRCNFWLRSICHRRLRSYCGEARRWDNRDNRKGPRRNKASTRPYRTIERVFAQWSRCARGAGNPPAEWPGCSTRSRVWRRKEGYEDDLRSVSRHGLSTRSSGKFDHPEASELLSLAKRPIEIGDN